MGGAAGNLGGATEAQSVGSYGDTLLVGRGLPYPCGRSNCGTPLLPWMRSSTIGALTAYLFSLVRYVLLGIPESGGFFGNSYFSVNLGMIITFVLLSRYIEERAKYRTNDALRKLISLAPKQGYGGAKWALDRATYRRTGIGR